MRMVSLMTINDLLWTLMAKILAADLVQYINNNLIDNDTSY